jgi:lipoprotein-anchoring transpeptidase ErfK/SrfK
VRSPARVIALGLLVACGLVGLAAAFGLAASAGAGTGQTTVTSTEPPPTTTTEPAPPAEPPVAPAPTTPAPIPFGVTVGGVTVGGLMPERAATRVRKSFARPLVLVVEGGRVVQLAPGALGAQPKVDKAIRRARSARPGAAIPLDVAVSRERIRTYVDRLARRVDRKPVDATLKLDGVKPRAVPSQAGRHLKQLETARGIRTLLATNGRKPLRLPFVTLKPEVTSAEFDQAIVVLRESKRLLLFDDVKLVRWFPVATGQASYPTPLGTYEVVNMQRNPWWYPPPSRWAQNADPVPPGPGNPLGTRWIGISAPYVGIHGTPDAASIGYSASHGCIRMKIPDAEWLFQRVDLGTPVFIIPR